MYNNSLVNITGLKIPARLSWPKANRFGYLYKRDQGFELGTTDNENPSSAQGES